MSEVREGERRAQGYLPVCRSVTQQQETTYQRLFLVAAQTLSKTFTSCTVKLTENRYFMCPSMSEPISKSQEKIQHPLITCILKLMRSVFYISTMMWIRKQMLLRGEIYLSMEPDFKGFVFYWEHRPGDVFLCTCNQLCASF